MADFACVINLFHPLSIKSSWAHTDLHEPIPGTKDEAGNWETRGHSERILKVNDQELSLFAKLFEEAGLPPGVLNLVTGPGASVGNRLVTHPQVKGISFTGSTEIGTNLYAQGAHGEHDDGRGHSHADNIGRVSHQLCQS